MEIIEECKYVVCVRCFTFNHANYIEDAMNGFCMQQTSFPFVCALVDDASTDGEPAVIHKYLDDNFNLKDKSVVRNEETDDYVLTFAQHKTNKNCYFAVFILKYNHYSSLEQKECKFRYIGEWYDNAKYLAICEGDDYWIHPQKLQMQVDFLENNQSYTMVCNNTAYYSVKRNLIIGNKRCYEQSQEVDRKDVILKGGGFISTCSVIYRPQILDNYPGYCQHCHVGDYPLQIMAAMKGRVYYFDDVFAVYRTENPNSWCGRQEERLLSERRLNGMLSEIRMLQGFQKDYPQFESSFIRSIKDFIFNNMPKWSDDPDGYSSFSRVFQTEICSFSRRDRLKLKWMKSRCSKTYSFYSLIRNLLTISCKS